MNQFLSNKIIAGIVAVALLVGVGVLVSSGDTSSTTRNAALVVATPCTKPGQVTKVSKQSVVCAKTNTGSLWYATMKAKGKAQPCAKPGAIRQKSDIVWVCGVVKKKKLWQATQPLTALAAKGDLPSTTPATPDAPLNVDNAVLAEPAGIDTAATQTLEPAEPTALSLKTQPSGGVNALALETQPVVQLLDQRGSSISTAGITITAVSGRTDVVLSGNTTVTDAKGRAIFKTLSLTGIMGDIALTFTAPRLGLEGITSGNLVLAAGVATALVSDTTLGAVAAGQRFNQEYKLHLADSSGNVVAISGRDVVVSSSPEGLYGYTTVPTAKDGYVKFKDLTLAQTGITTLTFASGDLSTTSTVVVKPSNSQGLKITTEVSQAATNYIAFAQSPVVQLLDAEGNKVTTEGITVTATITQFPTNDADKVARLLGETATSKTNKDGVATFFGLGIKGLIGDYILGFTPDNGVTQPSDKTVTLKSGELNKLTMLTAAAGPEGDSTAGTWSLTQSPVIGLLDISNNEVTKSGVTVTAIVTGQDPTFSADTDAQGKATFPFAFNGTSAGDRTITYKASNVNNLTAEINLPLLTPVVKTVLALPSGKNTTSKEFTLTAPTSNSLGAWTYTSDKPTIATVTAAGAVKPTGDAGYTTITATQAATTKYTATTSEADLDIALTPTEVTRNVAYEFDKNITSAPFLPTTLPMSNSGGTWSYSGSPTTFATVTADGTVTPTGVPGKTKITATQAATTKYASGARSEVELTIMPTTYVTENVAYPSDKNTTSAPFLPTTPPTSNSGGTWSYSGSPTTFATVDARTGSVTPTGVPGTTTITATLAKTGKFESITSEATLVIALTPTEVTQNVAYEFDKNTYSFNPTTLPKSKRDGGWTYTSSNPAMVPVDATTGNVIPSASVAGTVTITATQAATPMYASATSTYTGIYQTIIGKTGPGGGKVFYAAEALQPWGRYLEAAPNDYQVNGLRSGVKWDCFGTTTGATATAIGTGKANTATIVTWCPTAGTAAHVAADYRGGGKSDWFLPSRGELNEMRPHRGEIGGFAQEFAPHYWSSSEDCAYSEYYQGIYRGPQGSGSECNSGYVRPVRAFGTVSVATTGTYQSIIGRTGPGGGIVFYVATEPFKCGVDMTADCKYLEAATTNGTTPSTWTQDTRAKWSCYGTNVMNTTQQTASVEFGRGRANTILITGASCNVSTSAASIAKAYNGGGKTDWFLPSKKELNELCKYARTQTTGNTAEICSKLGTLRSGFAQEFVPHYWSSSEINYNARTAWYQSFGGGNQDYYSTFKDMTYYVRPVRAF